ncbi:polysaccharide deacetylase family protein [Salinicoccus halitifaciens]|uniref:polysaccharide deacetylase family protein n=1 Tax=Salinicoccus halitifaciens TaxID=1073415 RepID=UPI001E60DD37|nr:polysaccharide deacetylase family protein [Salinicoccus halitifaciens]MCD2136464.1 polysaccharide deacetylase family protein [Salinicoccus halitifaciens]
MDFEIFWGFIDFRDRDKHWSRLRRTPDVASKLIDVFEENEMKVTWSTVGMLMLEDSDDLKRVVRDFEVPNYTDPKRNNYNTFMGLMSNPQYSDGVFFARELVEKLKASKYQDIGTHTFSHYYCLEKGQKNDEFQKDLSIALAVAEDNGINIESIVFPKNQYNAGTLALLKAHGIASYRGNPDQYIYKTRPVDNLAIRAAHLLDTYWNIAGHITHTAPKAGDGLYNIKASRFLRPVTERNRMFKNLQLRRIKKEMTHAAKNNHYYHLWWHPHNFSGLPEENISYLREIIDHFKYLNKTYDFRSESMESFVEKVKANE